MNIIYEDEKCIAYLSNTPAIVGHTIVQAKETHVIIEQMPDELFGHLMQTANMLSSVLFETLGAQGTNILVLNGVEAGQEEKNVQVHVLPRTEKDGIDFRWKPFEDKEKMDIAQIKLKGCTEKIIFTKEKPKAKELPNLTKKAASTSWIEKALLRLP